MCNAKDCKHGFDGFADLDDLDAAPVAAPRAPTAAELEATETVGNARNISTTRFEEKCPKCRGTGRFRSFAGRDLGDCFACKGTGKRIFRTSPQVREAARDRAAAAKLEQRLECQRWIEADVYRIKFLNNNTFDFAMKMGDALREFGTLTEGQRAAIDRCCDRDRQRDAERAQRAAAPVDPTGLDLTVLPSGFYAVPQGDTRLKLRVRLVKEGKWAGWVFVDDGAAYGQGRKYGSQRPGARYQGQCVEQLRAILENPREASAAYGRLVGVCGVCGRKLEDEESVARGIGPICAGKF